MQLTVRSGKYDSRAKVITHVRMNTKLYIKWKRINSNEGRSICSHHYIDRGKCDLHFKYVVKERDE